MYLQAIEVGAAISILRRPSSSYEGNIIQSCSKYGSNSKISKNKKYSLKRQSYAARDFKKM